MGWEDIQHAWVRYAHTFVVGKLERKRPLGRPIHFSCTKASTHNGRCLVHHALKIFPFFRPHPTKFCLQVSSRHLEEAFFSSQFIRTIITSTWNYSEIILQWPFCPFNVSNRNSNILPSFRWQGKLTVLTLLIQHETWANRTSGVNISTDCIDQKYTGNNLLLILIAKDGGSHKRWAVPGDRLNNAVEKNRRRIRIKLTLTAIESPDCSFCLSFERYCVTVHRYIDSFKCGGVTNLFAIFGNEKFKNCNLINAKKSVGNVSPLNCMWSLDSIMKTLLLINIW
jgi:hypothetical protein